LNWLGIDPPPFPYFFGGMNINLPAILGIFMGKYGKIVVLLVGGAISILKNMSLSIGRMTSHI